MIKKAFFILKVIASMTLVGAASILILYVFDALTAAYAKEVALKSLTMMLIIAVVCIFSLILVSGNRKKSCGCDEGKCCP